MKIFKRKIIFEMIKGRKANYSKTYYFVFRGYIYFRNGIKPIDIEIGERCENKY